MYRGQVTAVTTGGIFVQTADYGTLGPLQAVTAPYAAGDYVLLANTGDDTAPDLVVVGTLSATGSGAHPPTSTDNAVARFDGTAGGLQNSGVTINDSQQVSGVAELLIQAVGNPSDGGGGSIRTAGSTYTFVIMPRANDANYAGGAEFYYDTSVPRWNCETNFWVEGRLVLRSGTDYGAEIGYGGPTITSGTGAPSHSAPNGSVFLRTDGTASTTLYVRAGGAWSALS